MTRSLAGDVDAPPEVYRFVELLPDDFALVGDGEAPVTGRPPRRRGRCIEAARLMVSVMSRLHVPAKALACDVVVLNGAARQAAEAHIDIGDWPPDAWSCGAQCAEPSPGANISEPYRRLGFGGHLVVAGEGWFVDLTVAQFDRPEHGITIAADAGLVGAYDPTAAGARCELPRDAQISWIWRAKHKAWRTTPAWRQDVSRPLALTMAERIRG